MAREEMILERLTRIEEQLGALVRAQQPLAELKEDLSPLLGSAFRILMQELGEVEFGFQLEDLFALMKRSLRSIRSITYTLEQLQNLVDLWQTLEPLLKSLVPNLIDYLDGLEQKGVFRTYAAMLEVRAKVAAHYPPEEISAMADGFVLILGILKKLSHPETVRLINRFLDLPRELKLEEVKPYGPVSVLFQMGSKEARQGLGVMLELTKAMGRLKTDGNGG
jgi:uncharacterized protein YjgD (DUF1641 family)